MSHTNSKTWVAPKMAEQERFEEVYENLNKMDFIHRSPFVPKNMNEWLAHRVAFAEDARVEEMRKLSDKQAASESGSNKEKVRILPPFKGKQFRDNRSSVLSMPSIWTPTYEPSEESPQAPWPTFDEMREEGDERNTSGFGRFPALPRVPGNETVAWKQKNVIKAFPLDKVWAVPKLEPEQPEEEGELGGEELTEEELLGKDLVEHLNR